MMCILRALVFIGRNNLALRGHRNESGSILENDTGMSVSTRTGIHLDICYAAGIHDGVFRDLLRLHVANGCEALQIFLQREENEPTYTSSVAVNDILQSMGDFCINKLSNTLQNKCQSQVQNSYLLQYFLGPLLCLPMKRATFREKK